MSINSIDTQIDNFGKNYFENKRISFSVQLLKEPSRIQKFKKLVNIFYSKNQLENEK